MEEEEFIINTTVSKDKENAFQMYADSHCTKLIATDGDGVEDESENSFEFDMQPDDIYDLTVF